MLDPVSFVELHEGFFMNGVNMPTKLPTSIPAVGKGQLKMNYDHASEWLIIDFKGTTAHIPKTSIKVMVLGEKETTAKDQKFSVAENIKIENNKVVKATVPQGKIKAQASSPVSHVFDGPGAGKR